MSSFSQTVPLIVDDQSGSTPDRLDQAVAATRASTPQNVQDQRSNPRFSIKELNDLDLEQIKDRMAKQAFDTRGPITRFLDLLDVPRNTIASTLFPAIRKRKELEGETGTFGTGTVHFSDILGEMGMRPGIIRGVLGFAGDLATDPLTYAGPGNAIKSLSSLGKNATARFARSGTRALTGGIRAVTAGKEIANPLVRDVAEQFVRQPVLDRLNALRVSKGLTPVTDAEKAQLLSKRIFGDVAVKKTSSTRFLNPAEDVGGSQIAGRFNAPSQTAALEGDANEALGGLSERFRVKADARARAVKNFSAEYGAAAKAGEGPIGLFRRAGQVIPSLRIGSGGSLVAHIPLTDIGIYAPSITGNARMAVAQRAASLASEGAPNLAGAVGRAFQAAKTNAEMVRHVDDAEWFRKQAEASGDGINYQAALDLRDKSVEAARANVEGMRGEFDRMAKDPGYGNLSVGDMQYQRQMLDTAQSAANMAEEKLRAQPFFQQLEEKLKSSPPSTALDPQWIKTGQSTLWDSAVAKAKAEGAPDINARAIEIANDHYSLSQRKLLAMDDPEIEHATAQADALHSYMESAYKLAQRTRGSIASHLNDTATTIADQAKYLLGLGPDDLGSSIFVSPKTIAQSLAGGRDIPLQAAANEGTETLARVGREALGNKRAGINDARSNLVRMMRGGGNDVANEVARPVQQAFADLVAKHGWNAEQQEAAKAVAMARMYESHPNAGNAFWATDMAGNPSRFVTTVKNAADLGIDIKDLDPIVEQARKISADLGEYGQASGDLRASQVSDNYIPKRSTPEFNKFDQTRSVPRGTEGAPRAGDFAQPSKTWQYRFKGEDGQIKRFFEFDRWLAGLSDEQIQAMELPAASQAKIQEIRDTIGEFDKTYKDVDPALRTQLLGRATDPMELNDLVQQGYFQHLFGTDAPEGLRLFSEDPVWTLRERVADQAKATARSNFEQSVGRYGIDAGKDAVAKRRGVGQEFAFQDGTKGTILPNQRFRVGGTIYRALAKDLKLEGSLMDGIMGNREMTKFYPEQVAEQIERGINWSKDSANQNALLRAMDKISGLWKATALARPAWIIGNVGGNLWNMGMGGVDFRKMGRLMKPVWEAMALGKNPGELIDKTVTLRGVPTSLDALRMQAIEHGVLNTNSAAEMMQHLYPQAGMARPVSAPAIGIRDRLSAFGRLIRSNYQNALEASLRARGAGATATTLDKLGAGMEAARDGDYVRKFLNPWAAANGYVEGYMRMLSYATMIDQGMDARVAANKVKEFLYDFTDLTRSEANARRLVPFFSWIRNNASYQLRQFLQNPKWAVAYPKVKHAIEESVAGDQVLPEHMRPSWMREQLSTQLSGDPASRSAFTATNIIPTEPVLHAGAAATGGWKGIMDLANFAGSSLNPILSVPLQLGTGREFFSGRTIGADSTEGDITAPEFLANQVLPGPIKDLAPTGVRKPALIQAFGRSPQEGLLRLALGGRVQPMDQDRVDFQNLREMKDKEERIRRAIAVAEREGNVDASQKARAVLLQLYENARKKGMEKAIPKWAIGQLEEVDADVQPAGV